MGKLRYIMKAQEETVVISNNDSADKFEKRIRELFTLLDFKKVNGGPTFKIGGNQIDACGICEDRLIICECTTIKGNFKAKLSQFKGIQSSIKRGLSEIPEYREYNSKDGVIFILATQKNFDFEQYSELGDVDVHFWNLNKVKYYELIAKNIKNRARYDLLADLNCQIKDIKKIKIPAFKVVFNNIEMYSFFAQPNDLIKVSYVARRESGNVDFYQRMLEPKRLNNIRKFLKDEGIFPTNIVVGMEGKADFKKIKVDNESDKEIPKWVELGILTLPKSYKGCWVIDGQHRLFSFELGMKQKIAVLALSNVSPNKQADFFVKINKEAKPIKSNLIWDLRGDLSPNDPEGIISNAVKILNTSKPFEGKITIPSQGSGVISMTTFCETLKKVNFGEKEIKTGLNKSNNNKNPFYNSEYKKHSQNIADSIKDFYAAIQCFIDDTNKEKDRDVKNFIFSNSGVSIFIQLYKIIICIADREINEDLAQKYILPIVEYIVMGGPVKMKEYKRRCSSEIGKTDVLKELLEVIKDEHPLISQFIGENIPLNVIFANFELNVRNFISKKLIGEKIEDIKENIDKTITIEVEKRIKKNKDYSLKEFCDNLTLGESRRIICESKYLWNKIFKNIFTRPESINISSQDIRLPNEDIFKVDFNYVAKTRNDVQHSKQKITKNDEKRVKDFINIVSSIIEI